MTSLLKICGSYLGTLIFFSLQLYSMETGRVLLTLVSIVAALLCLHFVMLNEGEELLILARWPSARTPSLIFGKLFVMSALFIGAWGIWNTAIPQTVLGILSFGFGLNFLMIGFCPDELPEQEH